LGHCSVPDDEPPYRPQCPRPRSRRPPTAPTRNETNDAAKAQLAASPSLLDLARCQACSREDSRQRGEWGGGTPRQWQTCLSAKCHHANVSVWLSATASFRPTGCGCASGAKEPVDPALE